jgi:hypothetical protein
MPPRRPGRKQRRIGDDVRGATAARVRAVQAGGILGSELVLCGLWVGQRGPKVSFPPAYQVLQVNEQTSNGSFGQDPQYLGFNGSVILLPKTKNSRFLILEPIKRIVTFFFFLSRNRFFFSKKTWIYSY